MASLDRPTPAEAAPPVASSQRKQAGSSAAGAVFLATSYLRRTEAHTSSTCAPSISHRCYYQASMVCCCRGILAACRKGTSTSAAAAATAAKASKSATAGRSTAVLTHKATTTTTTAAAAAVSRRSFSGAAATSSSSGSCCSAAAAAGFSGGAAGGGSSIRHAFSSSAAYLSSSSSSAAAATTAACGRSTLLCRTFAAAAVGGPQQQQQQQQTDYSFEYPLATEPPQVKKTTAREAPKETSTPTKKVPPGPDAILKDPFDDGGRIPDEERRSILERQKSELERSLLRRFSGSAITPEVPPHVPRNVPAAELETPETLLTTLDNGVRVVSQETYGQVSTVGAVCQVGSRFERADNGNSGVTNLLELLAFGSTRQYSALEVTQLLQDWGGTRFCNTGREQSLYCIDLLRPNADKAMDLLRQVLLESTLSDEEVLEAKRALEFQGLDLPPELLLSEAIQLAAFGPDQQLGRPHFALSPEQVAHLTPDIVSEFWNTQMVTHPSGLVIAGAGVKHDFLVNAAEQHFGHLRESSDGEKNRTVVVPSTYRGGQENVQFQPMDGLTRVAVALPTGGWDSDDLVTTCVLQTLLGGGNSFSAGGPGKGMYSRLYRQVLNRYSWAESSEAFTAFYQEAGLWGISGHTVPHKTGDMISVFCEHMLRLANEPVSDEELDRARNMLKCNVLTQLESRLVLFEDLARQVLTYGQREDMHETCLKIEAVSKTDIMEFAQRSLSSGGTPTVAAVGNDLTHIPPHSQISEWLGCSSSS